MSCDTTRFTINKRVDNTFLFTIKASGSTLPLNITNGTFAAKIVSLDPTNVTEELLPVAKESPFEGGQVKITVSEALAGTLLSEKGTKADRYYTKPTYKLIIEATGTDDGDFLAVVPEVYVD